MTARMRRLASDWEQVRKDFAGHKNIVVTPVGDQPPEKYQVTYFVNGIYLQPDGSVQTLTQHEVEITLHAEYPRYKPICKILTPIWHPNFRDGQICIGDIWGAGESLTDIIINIGDMIQYKSWNSYSPLSADAAKWAIEHKEMFPVGDINLLIPDYASAKDSVDIDLFGDDGAILPDPEKEAAEAAMFEQAEEFSTIDTNINDFDITAEELEGIEFVPTAQRMQNIRTSATVKGGKISLKTILIKGILFALIGSFLGFGIGEIAQLIFSNATAARLLMKPELGNYYAYTEKADKAWDKFYNEYEKYCRQNGLDADSLDVFKAWLSSNNVSEAAQKQLEIYNEYDAKASDALDNSYVQEFHSNENRLLACIKNCSRISTAFWAGAIALLIGLALGVGEGIYYGSFQKALLYGAIGAAVALIMGFISGYMAQWMYALLTDILDKVPEMPDLITDFIRSIIRGMGWSIMGFGIGLATGLIKPQFKRILYCCLGGMIGGFLGGFLFNYIFDLVPKILFFAGDSICNIIARGIAIVIMGLLIGLGVGLLEQFAKQAWLKVIRGEFEGKEYLVFSGVTSIGNTGRNTIVLFKDKLVGEHHCDITLSGKKYILTDCGTPMGTVVNGNKVKRHMLRHGDIIAIGNSALVFNTK